ncbi:hypothetical protein PPL_08328 [Heterostelium album PN500]|uniref:Uncharacterized protein n=1 Tax=Heterostelium pallidum (strain ATCC 26659 / Pp 5 / PN500) TaxID=670386 RepID=D3BHW0_HETP5|nr:hypothetical protein PPL_08328 [Heterostelium album PN500]EFA78860.1 hypothetical protein PPL_08328 [Heterostelium album PN500]|eukprot:XP_020430984.1 hypothetical protein PPL_08328 [Heterostelium album PN500]
MTDLFITGNNNNNRAALIIAIASLAIIIVIYIKINNTSTSPPPPKATYNQLETTKTVLFDLIIIMALSPVEHNQISSLIPQAEFSSNNILELYQYKSITLKPYAFSNAIQHHNHNSQLFPNIIMNTLMPQFDIKHQSTTATMSSAADTLMGCSPNHHIVSPSNIYFDFGQLHHHHHHHHHHYNPKSTNSSGDLVASSTDSSESEKESGEHHIFRMSGGLTITNGDDEDEDDMSDSDEESLKLQSSSTDEEQSDLDMSEEEEDDVLTNDQTATEYDDDSSSEYEDDDEEDDDESSSDYEQEDYNLRKSSSSLVVRKYLFNNKYDEDEDDDDEEEEDDESGDSDFDNDDNNSGSCSSDLSLLDEFEDLMPPTFSYSITSPVKELCANHNNSNGAPSKNKFYVETDDENDVQSELDDEEEERNKQDIHNALRYSISNGPTAVSVPCWFDNEDEDHIQSIIKEYGNYLQLDNEIKRIRRAPKPFVGRIHRRILQFGANKHHNEFMTIDTVKVYRWEIQPIGRPLKPCKTVLLLTTWDKESGFPIQFQPIESLSMKEYWMQASCSSNILQSSYIYCSPIFDRIDNYRFSVGTEKYPIDYLPSSPQLSVKRSSSPSLILSSHIYSHSLIPQNHFLLKDTSNDDS